MHKGIEPEITHTIKGDSILIRELQQYLHEGGYPEIIGESMDIRIRTLNTYLDVMIYRDLIERYDITNHNALRQYIKKMLSNSAKETSTHKTYLELKSQGYKISKDYIYNFQVWCEEIYLFFPLLQHHESLLKQQAGSKKTYCIDTGIINTTSFRTSQDKGRILENAVYTELRRREREIYYNKEGKECDFLIKEKGRISAAIQVSLSMEEESTKKRELTGLMHSMKKYNLNEGTIVTIAEESRFIHDGKTIHVQPLWKWLLSKER
jgi:predicted AAA+ superfamily ATPase